MRACGASCLLQIEYGWWVVAALGLFALAALASLTNLVKMGKKRRPEGTDLSPVNRARHRNPKWVSGEIERLCSGQEPDERLIKPMSAEDRAMFEVSVIDALNNRSPENQQRLRSALIRQGYDEQCARRVMSADLADRVRATALLTLLRPQWRDEPLDPEQRSGDEGSRRALAASHKPGPEID